MKNLFLALTIVSIGLGAQAFYDFCESPQDYNTFPASYDFKTEYWTDIPNYKPNNIKFERKENNKNKQTPVIKIEPSSDETGIYQNFKSEE